jgi:hypothetical protein
MTNRPRVPSVVQAGSAALRVRLTARLSDESGIALVLALLIMLVLTIALTSTIFLTSASQRQASSSNAEQKALALAEEGLSNATSTLFSLADPRTGAVPSCGAAAGGTPTWCFQRVGTVWTLTGSGAVPNPAVAGGTLMRTVTKQFKLGASPIWQWNYSDATTGCMNVKNNATIGQPLYVRGNLCISNNAHFVGSALQVGGTLSIGNGGSVGSSGSPIAQAKLQGGCLPNAHPCTTADSVYATSISQTIDNLTKPPVDVAGWYQNAQPGPMHPCTSGSVPGGFDSNSSFDTSRASFALTPTTSYDCVVKSGSTTIGQLSWNATTNVLTIAGTIFFDGPIQISGTATYQGQATIYAAGAITFTNSSRLCGVTACDASWDPGTNLLVLVAGAASGTGMTLSNNAVYQGAAYVVSDYTAANNSINWGPVIAHQLDISNNSGFKPVTSVPPGAPGADTSLQEVPGSWAG